jgi:hypothetical protein
LERKNTKAAVSIVVLIWSVICILAGTVIQSGKEAAAFDAGERSAWRQVDRLLHDGLRQGVEFYQPDLKIYFVPRGDGKFIIAKSSPERR